MATAYPPTVVRSAPMINGTASQYAVTVVFAADPRRPGRQLFVRSPACPSAVTDRT